MQATHLMSMGVLVFARWKRREGTPPHSGAVAASLTGTRLMARLRDKRSLVTGGTTGIGLETAKQFLAEGSRVIVTGNNPGNIANMQAELGTDVLAIKADSASVAVVPCRVRMRPRSQSRRHMLKARPPQNLAIRGQTPVRRGAF